MNKIWLHGEVRLLKTKGSIPSKAKKVTAINGSYKIADSETTGNHHLLEAIDGVDLYEKDGVFFLKTEKSPVVKCVDEARHDTIQLEPCKEDEVFIIDIQQEADHLTDEVRNVAD